MICPIDFVNSDGEREIIHYHHVAVQQERGFWILREFNC